MRFSGTGIFSFASAFAKTSCAERDSALPLENAEDFLSDAQEKSKILAIPIEQNLIMFFIKTSFVGLPFNLAGKKKLSGEGTDKKKFVLPS